MLYYVMYSINKYLNWKWFNQSAGQRIRTQLKVPQRSKKEQGVFTLCGPIYVIGRIMKNNDIVTVFKPTSKVRDLIRPIKDNIP